VFFIRKGHEDVIGPQDIILILNIVDLPAFDQIGEFDGPGMGVLGQGIVGPGIVIPAKVLKVIAQAEVPGGQDDAVSGVKILPIHGFNIVLQYKLESNPFSNIVQYRACRSKRYVETDGDDYDGFI